MKNTGISKSQRVLLGLVAHNLFSAPLDIPEDVNWREVVDESVAQSLPLLAFKNFNELPIDGEVAPKLRKYLDKCAVSNIRCFKGHYHIHKLMTDGGVPYSIIKGAASSYYYPDPLSRSMGDVDFYVAPENMERALEIMLADGFENTESGSYHHLCLHKGATHVELHIALTRFPNDEMKPIFLEYWSDLCETAHTVSDAFSDYVIPSDFHHGFILLVHFQRHLMHYGIGLRHLCDWLVFADKFSSEEFLSIFETRLKRVGLLKLAQAMSLVGVKHLGMAHKEWMGEDYDTADSLLEDIMRGGNFGRRKKDKYFEVFFASDYQTAEGKKTRFARAFRSLNKYIGDKWPAAVKCPLLYPVGWIYFPVRFLFKRIAGKRRVSLTDGYKRSGERIRLYKSLHLYEPEE